MYNISMQYPLSVRSTSSESEKPHVEPSSFKFFLRICIILFLISFFFLFPLYQKVWIKLFSPSFSIVVLPDTQKYSESNPELFCKQTLWIVDNIQRQNIVFVSHVGDIVDGWKFKKKQWEVASECMQILDGKIPYGIVPGNHDTETGSRDSGLTTYDTYFPASRYNEHNWYKGNRKYNANSYQVLKIWGIEFVFLHLEIEPSDNTIKWANEIVAKYPNAYITVTTHKYLPDVGNARDKKREYSTAGNTGEDIWKKLIKENCAIRLVWSGHFHGDDGEALLVSLNTCGQTVYQTLQNYQTRENGGNGKLRIYTFKPNQQIVQVKTYSPVTDTFEMDDSSNFAFPFLYTFKDSWWRIRP